MTPAAGDLSALVGKEGRAYIRVIAEADASGTRRLRDATALPLTETGEISAMAQPAKTPRECRERAAECERLATVMAISGDREAMLYVAQGWRTLASEAAAPKRPLLTGSILKARADLRDAPE